MPTFGRIAPTVPVADLSRALRFYEGVLGFRVAFTNGNPLSFAVIKQGAAELHLSVQPGKAGSSHAHLMVDDLDGVYERLRQAGVTVQQLPKLQPWGLRDIAVADPDGNTFEVAGGKRLGVGLTEEAHVDRQRVTDYLRQIKVEELVAVLRDVFADRQPAPEEATFCRNRFFLGTAWSDLQSDEGEPEHWGPWQTDAVAYPNATKYGDRLGPDYGLCEAGTCGGCGLTVRSNVKQGLCPVCGVAVYMT